MFICDECIDVCVEIVEDDTRGLERIADSGHQRAVVPVAHAGLAIQCALCGLPAAVDDALLIAARGVLCPGCVGAIQIAVAQRRPVD